MTSSVSGFINRHTIARSLVLWTHSKTNSVYPGHKTYFIEGRQLYSPYSHENCLTPSNPINLRLIISPAASPQSVLSCNHSPLPMSPRGDDRSRKADCRNFLSPSAFHFRTKASSLPSILDSDTELDEKREKGFPETNSSSKSPTSVGEFFCF